MLTTTGTGRCLNTWAGGRGQDRRLLGDPPFDRLGRTPGAGTRSTSPSGHCRWRSEGATMLATQLTHRMCHAHRVFAGRAGRMRDGLSAAN